MKRFKLNELDRLEMEKVRGGDDPQDLIIPPEKLREDDSGSDCSCACKWVNQGGSSTSDNNAANTAGGLHSV